MAADDPFLQHIGNPEAAALLRRNLTAIADELRCVGTISSMGSANNCRACGYDWGEPPWGESGQEPSFWICPCCQVEAGYEDGDADGARAYRADWLARGAPWNDPSTPHDGLTTEERLAHVPPGFE